MLYIDSNLRVTSEEYWTDNVTVTTKWGQQAGSGVSHYTTRISPVAPSTLSIGSTSLQVILSYNTEYNLSLVAVTPCGNATSFIRLHYGAHENIILLLYIYRTNSVHY